MARWLSWGGIRGRGLSLKSDAVMSMVAVVMATLVLILAYFLFERSAVKMYCTTVNNPVVTKTDNVIQRIDKVWDSDLMMKTPDPLNPEIDPASLRSTAKSLNRELKNDTTKLHATRIGFSKRPDPPNPCRACVDKTGAFVRTADNYATAMQEVIKYLHDLALLEAPMNEAARAVQLSGSTVAPEALMQKDAILAAQLEKIKALKPPPLMKKFHDDTVSFLGSYLSISQQTTATYVASSGLAVLDTLGAQGETVLHNGRATLKEDITAVKSLMQGGQLKLLRGYRQAAREEIYDLMSKYRF